MTDRAGATVCGGFIACYAAFLLSQLSHGVATLDAHGIIAAVQRLVGAHVLSVSRPPGHPTTEWYFFGAIGCVSRAFGDGFAERAYLAGQAVAAVVALFVFYELLRRIGVKAWCSCVAVIALALSPQFFANAIDGEEFVFGVLFIVLAVRLLISDAPVRPLRLSLSAMSFALATGCRPELIFAGVIYPVYLYCTRADWRRTAVVLALVAAAIVLVWSPIFIVGVHAPLGAGELTARTAFSVAAYKMMFQAFGPIVFALLMFVLIRAILRLRVRFADPFPANFLRVLECALPLLFFVLFAHYPTKPAHVLVALPFLLIPLAEQPALLVAVAAFTAINDLITIDIFRDRELCAPFLTGGSAIKTLREKPSARLPYLRALLAQCDERPTAIIADVWPWDFQYHIRRGTFSADEQPGTDRNLPQFVAHQASACVMLPRQVAFEPKVIDNWRASGYAVKMDAVLYRTSVARYGPMRPPTPRDIALFAVSE